MILVALPEPAGPHASMSTIKRTSVDLLILGAGWTAGFLIPLLEKKGIAYDATSTSGRDGTIPFRFDPESDSEEPYSCLPAAKTVLITFPLKGPGQSKHLTSLYNRTHSSSYTSPGRTQWIQLGSSGIFSESGWNSSSSLYDTSNPRAVAEDELILLARGCVLNLAGLYDGAARDPRDWVNRVAKTKQQLAGKGALHLVHGVDVARAVVAMHEKFTPSTRWLVADMHTYDWWDLAQGWGEEVRHRLRQKAQEGADDLPYEQWVSELMDEQQVRALPRGVEELGRVLDSRGFWKEMGIQPIMTLAREPRRLEHSELE